MLKKTFNAKAAVILEYIMVMTVVVAALLLMQKYIVRGFAGYWKDNADTYGHGRQYDPAKTKERAWSAQEKVWYDKPCYDACYERSQSRLAACKAACKDERGRPCCPSSAYGEDCRDDCKYGNPESCGSRCFPKCLKQYERYFEACKARVERDCARQCQEHAGDQI